MGDNKEQETCEGDTNHLRAIPQGSAFQGQKKGHIRDIIRQFENQTQTYMQQRQKITQTQQLICK